jgi:hypothetical protein
MGPMVAARGKVDATAQTSDGNFHHIARTQCTTLTMLNHHTSLTVRHIVKVCNDLPRLSCKSFTSSHRLVQADASRCFDVMAFTTRLLRCRAPI